MKMSELTVSEREMLDKIIKINRKLVSDETQGMWNVCWGYLNGKFKDSLVNEPDSQIKKVLKEINAIAPKVCGADENVVARADEVEKSSKAALF